LNEDKRLIKVIDPAIIQKVVRRFEKVMSSWMIEHNHKKETSYQVKLQ
jgi:hypothetical protein